MQEQNASKAASLVARLGLWNIICTALFGTLLLVAAIVWLWPYSSLSTATWREANNTLPWEADGLRVEEVAGHWASSEGHERMALRAAYYPVANIKLGEAEGQGMLYITFADERERHAGDSISLYYDKGNFRPRKEVNVEAEGAAARVFIETGYERGTSFELHQHDESSPLWRIYLHYRPEGTAEMKYLGFVTIPAELQK